MGELVDMQGTLTAGTNKLTVANEFMTGARNKAKETDIDSGPLYALQKVLAAYAAGKPAGDYISQNVQSASQNYTEGAQLVNEAVEGTTNTEVQEAANRAVHHAQEEFPRLVTEGTSLPGALDRMVGLLTEAEQLGQHIASYIGGVVIGGRQSIEGTDAVVKTLNGYSNRL
jgi:hypothetical protein